MTILTVVKKYVPDMPRPIGNLLASIPFAMRPGWGGAYRRSERTLERLANADPDAQKKYIFERVYSLVKFAVANVPFYKRYYAECGFELKDLRSFEDISKIPMTSKEILRNVPLEERSSGIRRKTVTYTGGSTGEPFKFYSDSLQVGNEWAHMHRIWGSLGFRAGDLLLSVALEPKKPPVFYDALRHSLILNIHYPRETLALEYLRIPKKLRQTKFFRGYPSAWAEFLSFCETEAPRVLDEIRQTLCGSFLASEYPFPHFRRIVERATTRPTISWYGHSERAILAWERTRPFLYEPELSYGYCETTTDPSGFVSLVGTAYWNYASPFIRYRVDDGVKPIERCQGLLRSFEILEGRVGDYLIDKNNRKFSITHLNLSCRESTWAIARCIQVEQRVPGKAIVWVTPKTSVTVVDLERAFDFGDLNIDVEFRILERPVLSSRGKVLLKIDTQADSKSPSGQNVDS